MEAVTTDDAPGAVMINGYPDKGGWPMDRSPGKAYLENLWSAAGVAFGTPALLLIRDRTRPMWLPSGKHIQTYHAIEAGDVWDGTGSLVDWTVPILRRNGTLKPTTPVLHYETSFESGRKIIDTDTEETEATYTSPYGYTNEQIHDIARIMLGLNT